MNQPLTATYINVDFQREKYFMEYRSAAEKVSFTKPGHSFPSKRICINSKFHV